MWALKTNAMRRLLAQPTCGVLPIGATLHIRLGLNNTITKSERIADRLAIDYSLVESSVTVFDPNFIHRTDPDRKRKKLNVLYK
ncbi:hypothetical protein AB6A40_011071 [Gnathostoma spinigerum]|uniref:MSP domain-containing protein n=1 Tax=Gnathostoma spinigerum TaxID=75299 RepID=A0ABD6F3I9_9BILA